MIRAVSGVILLLLPSIAGSQDGRPTENEVENGPFPSRPAVRIERKTVALQEVRVQPLLGPEAAVAEVLAGRSTQIRVPGATAALAVDSDLLDASADQGVVSVSGRTPGRAEVLVVTPEGIKNMYVLVRSAPPAYPPGFMPIASAVGDSSGSYEFRFASDRTQIQNRFDFTSTKTDRTTQFHLINVDFLDGIDNAGHVNLPSGFYRITTPRWNFTLLDQNVTNSPLTVNNSIVRGIHLGVGHWTVHAGYSPLATFYDVLIPTEREAAFGLSHSFRLSPNSELQQNAYYFPTPSQSFTAGRPGTIASLEYRLRRPRGLELSGEAAFSHGLGLAGEMQWSDPKNFLHASFRQKPRDFASLSIGNLPGSLTELSWSRTLAPALVSNLNVSDSRILLPGGQQTNLNSTLNLQYKISRHWTVSTGGAHADFSQSFGNTKSSVSSLSLPEQINFDRRHFGAGFQYQFAKTSGSLSPGQNLRGTARFGWGGLHLSGFVERQMQALTVNSLYSQIPSLQIELQRLGLTAIDPTQLAALLQDNAFLLALGLSQQAKLNLVPMRLQTGASLNWTSHGARPQRLNLDFIRNNDHMVQGKASNWIQSGSYTLPLTAANELSVSYSWFHYSALGRAQYSPQVEIGLRHNFSSLPAFLAPGGHDSITGVVYVDEKMGGLYDPHMRTLAAVEVTLDGWNRTWTDQNGCYVFSRVAKGSHTVEAHFRSQKPFWFTTPSVVRTPVNQSVDFGITFAASTLVGYVRNDAGLGLPDTEIEISGPGGKLVSHSDADGRFAASGLSPGEYELIVDANSVPPGHKLDELQPIRRRLEAGIPESVEFRIHAMRTVFGRVSNYDPGSGQYRPLAGTTVEIPELSLQATTDRLGKFVFRGLPSGSYTLSVSGYMPALRRLISIPAGPIELQEDFNTVQTRNP